MPRLSVPALYSKPWPRDSLSVAVIHFCERGGLPNKLATVYFADVIAWQRSAYVSSSNSAVYLTTQNGTHTSPKF
jgi:hypothetical protein